MSTQGTLYTTPSAPRPGTLQAIAVVLAESASVNKEADTAAAGGLLSSPPTAMTSSADNHKAPASPVAVVHGEADGSSSLSMEEGRQGSVTVVRGGTERITPITVLCRTPISDSMKASFKNHAAERTSPTSPVAAKKGSTSGSLDQQQIHRLGRKFPKYARRLLELDTNGDGVLDEDEVEAALQELISAESQVKLLKWIVLALTIMTILLIGATFGVSIAAAFIAKDTQMSSSSTMTDKNTGWSVATGPSSMRNMEATDTLEQVAQAQAVASGQRRLLASADLSAAYDPLSSSSSGGDFPSSGDAGIDATGLSLRSQQRRLLQTPSLYGWVNAYGLSDTYAGLQDTWFSNNGLPTHATVLVVSKDTPQATIDALAANTKYWCPDIKSATPDTTKMEGFFLSVYYCDAVYQAQSTGTAPPTTYSCGCRLAIAKTKCKALSDPQNPMNLTCAQDTTYVNIYKATATCTVRSYNCPSKDKLQQAYQWGAATFGNPGFTLTSGGSMSTTSGSTTSGGSHHRRLMSVAGEESSRATHGRRLTQWDTDPCSINLDRTTSNTQTTSGSSGGWGR